MAAVYSKWLRLTQDGRGVKSTKWPRVFKMAVVRRQIIFFYFISVFLVKQLHLQRIKTAC